MAAVPRLRAMGDALLAVALTILVQAEAWLAPAPDADEIPIVAPLLGPLPGTIAGLVFTASLAWRQRAPLVVLVLAYPALGLARTASLDATVALSAAVMVATYSAGAHTRDRRAIAAALGTVGIVALTVLRARAGIGEPSDIALPLALFGGPWLAGLAIRERRDREAMLEERTILLERERSEQARAAAAEERARIAREMHDIVAHAMSVIVLQARGARRSLSRDPGAAGAALDAIEATSTDALAEMRGLLGALTDDDRAPLAPQPTLAALDGLVDQLREAGLGIEVDIVGLPRPLPPGLDRAAFRIVQESLTNVLRHGGQAGASVSIAYLTDALELTVRDAGTAVEGDVPDGRGIAGMRERATSLGGRLDAGADPSGGFAVRAWLPLSEAAG